MTEIAVNGADQAQTLTEAMTVAEPIVGSKIKTLARKLAVVMGEVERVPKRGRNTFHNYDYATEADILQAVRTELSKLGVMLFTRLIGYRREGGKTKKGDPITLWFVDVEFTFVDSESGESITTPWTGVGEDSSDKGLYKGLTGATKYFMLKTFLISTGDDPEEDSDDDRGDRRHQHRQDNAASTARVADQLREQRRASADGAQPPAPVEPTIPKDGVYTPLQLKHVEKDAAGQPIVFGILTAELGDWMLETKDREIARGLVDAKKAGRKVVIEWSTVNGHRVIDQISSAPATGAAA